MGYLDKNGLAYLWGKVTAALSGKQNILTGSSGQLVGFDAEGKAVAQAAPSGGMTQEGADARYLQLSGGTMTGNLTLEEHKVELGQVTPNYSFEVPCLDVHSYKTEFSTGIVPMFGQITFLSSATLINFPIRLDTRIRGVANPSIDTDAANKQYVDQAIAGFSGGVPSGCILIWSGAAADVPSGWALCDGTNGTPDLRGRFVLGAGGTYNPGAQGGSEEVALTVEQMPSHGHRYVSGVTTTHKVSTTTSGSTLMGIAYETTDNTGGGAPHANMPPYYALAYIMKL